MITPKTDNIDPDYGFRYVQHIWILDRTPNMVQIQFYPFGHAKADPKWMRVSTFHKLYPTAEREGETK